MDIETVFGVKWRLASYPEILVIIGLIITALLIFIIIRALQYLKYKKIHDHQLFLFRMKRIGLSNFQIKIMNNLIETLNITNPNLIFDKPELFEKAVGKFFDFLKRMNESGDTLESICKDTTITYEKLYYPSRYKKPLNNLAEIETSQLLYFVTEQHAVFLGRIISTRDNSLLIQLFGSARYISLLNRDTGIHVFIWRVGDAEYEFKSKIQRIDGTVIQIEIPEDFIRDKEFRHPYIDVLVPAELKKLGAGVNDEDSLIQATLLKLNDYEAVLRLSRNLDYRSNYEIDFDLMEFQVKASVRILANKTIEDGSIFYYTVKFQDMSDVAEKVLRKYIYEHL